MAQCLFRDGPHVCGEEAAGPVGLVFGSEERTAPACSRHFESLNSTFHAAAQHESGSGALELNPVREPEPAAPPATPAA